MGYIRSRRFDKCLIACHIEFLYRLQLEMDNLIADIDTRQMKVSSTKLI